MQDITNHINLNDMEFLKTCADKLNFGELHFKFDPSTGLIAIIAIHNTNLGPALGGCRYKYYPTTNEAIFDVMRLARGMSYKSALANLPLGGGKSVIIKTSQQIDRPQLFKAFGSFVESLNGRYIAAVDSGTKPEDMDIIALKTRHVAGMNGEDPSPFTAKGLKQAILAAVKYKYDKINLENMHIAIQGVGNVGYFLAKELVELGAKLTITDVSAEILEKCAKELSCQTVDPEKIYDVPCDIFAPCALGAVLNDETIPRLQTKMVIGAANNQLAEDRHGYMLHERGIMYGPDYLVNAGGVIHACAQYFKLSNQEVLEKVDKIYDTCISIFKRAEYEKLPCHRIADEMAEEKLKLGHNG